MASITDYVKEGLKYPFNDYKKVLTFGIIFLISSLISFLMQYFVFDSIRVMGNSAPVETVQSAIAAVPPSNMGLMVLFWIMSFILMIFVAGYVYVIIRYSIENKYELPSFNDIKKIFLNGIRAIIVGIAYSIAPALLFFLGLMLAVNENVGGTVNSIGGLILVIAFIFAIFCGLLEVMALSHMVANDELSAAFRFKEVLALIKNIGWGKYIGVLLFVLVVVAILSIFIGFIFGAIAFAFSALIGSALVLVLVNLILNALLLNPYISIVISRIYGSIYREAINGESISVESASDE